MTSGPIRLYMSMSLDGYITGVDDRLGQGLGREGGRLFNWLDDRNEPGINGQVYAEAMATGALISGRRTSSSPAAGAATTTTAYRSTCSPATRATTEALRGTTFYTDVSACAADARAAAGDRAVMVHGASAAQALLRAGELDEMEIHLIPVLLGAGRRLFEDTDRVELERVRQLEGRDATHLRYRVGLRNLSQSCNSELQQPT